jgi:hypothetical protein
VLARILSWVSVAMLADGLDRARRADRDQDSSRTRSGQIGVRPTRRQVSSNACNGERRHPAQAASVA